MTGDDASCRFPAQLLSYWQPLAPLGELPPEGPPEATLPRLLRRIDERLEGELPPAEAKRLLMAAWVLIGMRVGRSKLKSLRESIEMVDIRDSSTYWEILEEGIAEGEARGEARGKAYGLRAILLEVGSRRLGSPPPGRASLVERDR